MGFRGNLVITIYHAKKQTIRSALLLFTENVLADSFDNRP